MAKTLRSGDLLRQPDGIIGELVPGVRAEREGVLAQIPASWRTTLDKAGEWPFPDPDQMLDTGVESFGDYPADEVPAEIVPFSDFEPWGKMEEETPRDYELFSYYRAIGLSRTFAKTAKHFSISQTYIGKVAAKHDWITRVEEWDKYREKIYTTEVIDGIRKMAEEHTQITQKGIRALSIAFDELLARVDSDDPVHRQEMEMLSLKSIYAMVEKAARVLPNLMNAERLSRGMPTELTAQVVIREDRIVVQTTDELAEIVQGLGAVLSASQPEEDEIVLDGIEIEDIEDAVLVDD